MYLFTDTKITFVAVLTRWRGKIECVKLGEVAVVSALIRGSEQCYEALLYTAALNASLSHTVGYLLLHIQSLSNTFFMLDVKLSLCLLMLDVANSRASLWTSGTFLSRFSCRREKSLDGNLWLLCYKRDTTWFRVELYHQEAAVKKCSYKVCCMCVMKHKDNYKWSRTHRCSSKIRRYPESVVCM